MIRRGAGLSRSQVAGLFYPATQLRSGQRIGTPTGVNVLLTTAVAADVMYAFPIPVPASGSLSGVAVQVGTAVPGVSAKLGLAAPGADGFPATLLAEAPTPVDMNSVADTELVALFSASILRSPGMLWGLCVFNGAAQPVTFSPFSIAMPFVGHLMGANSISVYTGRNPAGTSRVSRAHTYASAFPAALTGWTTANALPSSPIMAAVIA